ncbi:MAG: hypothetical protein U1F45_07765 [Burkholderiales bacterium]
MAVLEQRSGADPVPSAVTIAHVVYALHAFAIVAGIAGTATIVGSFIGSVPSIVAVILNYAKRGDARGTWIDSHYRWQIRTFWFALAWFLVGWFFILTLVGVVVGGPILIALTVWLVYRIARGWLRLNDRRPMYV